MCSAALTTGAARHWLYAPLGDGEDARTDDAKRHSLQGINPVILNLFQDLKIMLREPRS
ncbi:hypothetical protein [Sphingorhabdus sp.]|uniref:hypothetical protein n=1 Tax=Sphingorhabdus sp. TaxID=1902408 RepID=UPI003918AFFA